MFFCSLSSLALSKRKLYFNCCNHQRKKYRIISANPVIFLHSDDNGGGAAAVYFFNLQLFWQSTIPDVSNSQNYDELHTLIFSRSDPTH